MTNNNLSLSISLIIGFLALHVGFVFAAIAPLSPKALKETANHIVTGEVLEVTSMIRKSKTGFLHLDRGFQIKVKVTGIRKGSGIKLTEKTSPFFTNEYTAVGKYGTGKIYEFLKKEILKNSGKINERKIIFEN